MILPKPTGAFEWTQESWGPALRCTALTSVALHCFSTRALDVSGARDEDAGSWLPLARALNIDAKAGAIVRLRQVHCAGVFEASQATLPKTRHAEWPEADIAISRDPS